MHMVQTAAIQIGKNLTSEERFAFTHDVAAPTLYKYSDAAYYSESEYSADDWKLRFVLNNTTLNTFNTNTFIFGILTLKLSLMEC